MQLELSEIANELLVLTPMILFQIFIGLVVLDIVTGFVSAKINNTFSSREATNGLMRQGLRIMYFLVLMYVYGLVATTSAPLALVIMTIKAGLIVAYVKSILENYKKVYPDN